jgi:hypothetical protein
LGWIQTLARAGIDQHALSSDGSTAQIVALARTVFQKRKAPQAKSRQPKPTIFDAAGAVRWRERLATLLDTESEKRRAIEDQWLWGWISVAPSSSKHRATLLIEPNNAHAIDALLSLETTERSQIERLALRRLVLLSGAPFSYRATNSAPAGPPRPERTKLTMKPSVSEELEPAVAHPLPHKFESRFQSILTMEASERASLERIMRITLHNLAAKARDNLQTYRSRHPLRAVSGPVSQRARPFEPASKPSNLLDERLVSKAEREQQSVMLNESRGRAVVNHEMLQGFASLVSAFLTRNLREPRKVPQSRPVLRRQSSIVDRTSTSRPARAEPLLLSAAVADSLWADEGAERATIVDLEHAAFEEVEVKGTLWKSGEPHLRTKSEMKLTRRVVKNELRGPQRPKFEKRPL